MAAGTPERNRWSASCTGGPRLEGTSMRRTLLALGLVMSVGGCELYMGEDDYTYSYCDDTGCYECDDFGCWSVGGPGGGGGGWGGCTSNWDCAGGCWCDTSTGVCVETGFCSTDADCTDGNVCDDRSSCVPPGSITPGCDDDADCAYGSYCDELSGSCVGSWTCTYDTDCGAGYSCDARGTCIPTPCTSDDQCLQGC